MEPITHLAAGLLTAQALRPAMPPSLPPSPEAGRRTALGFTLLCAAAATIPDIDSLTSLLGPEAYLLHHRGFTHSLVLLPAFALLLAWTARRLGADVPLRLGFPAAALALLTHLYLDVSTAFGTQLFAPFSSTRVSFEGLFIVDPAFTLALFGFALAARLQRQAPRKARALALCGLALLVGYPLAGNALRLDMQSRYEAMLATQGRPDVRVDIAPDALAPFYWKVVLTDGQDVRVTTATLFDIAAPYPVLRFERLDRAELERLGRQVSFFGTYAWFAMHPAERPATTRADTQSPRERRFLDAVYVNASPVLTALFGSEPGFAECAAYLDGSDRLVAWRDWRGHTHPVPEAGSGPGAALAGRIGGQ
jgi:inner membrane protein